MAAQSEDVQERLEAYLSQELGEPEDEAPQEVSEETQDDESEADDSTEEAAEAEDTEDESEADDAQTESLELSDLAEYLGLEQDRLDVGDDGELRVKTKVDGEEGTAKLADLIKSYQLEGHLNKQNMEVAEQKKALAQKQEQFETQMQEKLNQAEDLIKISWQQLESESNTEQLDRQLAEGEISEGEYALQKMRFQEKQNKLAQMYQQIQQERQQYSGVSEERRQQTLAEEQQKLYQAIPEWQDPDTAKKERNEIMQYAKAIGFRDEEVSSFTDHRAVVALRKAMMFDNLQKSKPDLSKKVKRAPKITKPGQPKSKEESGDKKVKDLRRSIKKSGGKDKGSVNDFLAAKGII